ASGRKSTKPRRNTRESASSSRRPTSSVHRANPKSAGRKAAQQPAGFARHDYRDVVNPETNSQPRSPQSFATLRRRTNLEGSRRGAAVDNAIDRSHTVALAKMR